MDSFIWRPMERNNLDAVMALSEVVHPTLPESRETQEKRLRLYPEGCLVLTNDTDIQGYAFAHPIRHAAPPALNTAPEQVPADADELYLHDFVVSSSLRGRGYAVEGIETLLRLADRFATMGLISVYGTAPFWSKFGFEPCSDVAAAKLASYGADAVYMMRRANP
ncbi:GNAT family N-acetyltransferase [Bordetella sp. 15P40C-2]|uniref:GNAT family N-acetyltransferase n=1 Tax=Bordetella sp. 15P40C-2 TaxID=2572246 RepID=UPI00132AB9D0|nr:GNAT family N-acetyltransferase [Bordetella sp. 15P40C-2]MVW70351.1 GNAT family N-acetyltransferase [Bordetella sp. 15P40C-2]